MEFLKNSQKYQFTFPNFPKGRILSPPLAAFLKIIYACADLVARPDIWFDLWLGSNWGSNIWFDLWFGRNWMQYIWFNLWFGTILRTYLWVDLWCGAIYWPDIWFDLCFGKNFGQDIWFGLWFGRKTDLCPGLVSSKDW